MTDENLDRMIRDADVYRPDVIGHLDGAAASLLEEIMSVPTLKSAAGSPNPRSPRRRNLLGGLVGAGVAASVLAGFVAVSVLSGNDPGDGRAAAPGDGRAAAPGGSATQKSYPAMVLRAAEANPRLLIDEPGWKATTVYGFAEEEGTITYAKGGLALEMNWYRAGDYAAYRKDRLALGKPEAVQIAGSPGILVRYSSVDFAVLGEPRGASFVEVRTGGTWSRAEFDRVVGRMVRADVRTWLAALPASIVTPDKVRDQAAEMLTGVPLPPRFDDGALSALGTNDHYQFGAGVTGLVGCGWIAEWNRAKKSGDEAAAQRAGDALRGSHHWKILKELQDQGGWSTVFWETADDVVAGKDVNYKTALGCK
jgi:hypothetical protein